MEHAFSFVFQPKQSGFYFDKAYPERIRKEPFMDMLWKSGNFHRQVPE